MGSATLRHVGTYKAALLFTIPEDGPAPEIYVFDSRGNGGGDDPYDGFPFEEPRILIKQSIDEDPAESLVDIGVHAPTPKQLDALCAAWMQYRQGGRS